MTAKISLKNIKKSFYVNNKEVHVLDNISLNVKEKEFVSILGPSGCGKSTIFNIICGIEKPDSGDILLDGNPKSSLGKEIAYMPQKDLLLPWRTILENVIFLREIKDGNKKEIVKEAIDLMPFFGLEGFENSYPGELSGGMRQRAALMRTILAKKEILLLDEPFAALDAITRHKVQKWLLKIWSQFKKSVLFITHDVDEAIYLSDKIYVLSERPAKVSLEVSVNLQRPRSEDVLTEPHFLDIKKRILKAL